MKKTFVLLVSLCSFVCAQDNWWVDVYFQNDTNSGIGSLVVGEKTGTDKDKDKNSNTCMDIHAECRYNPGNAKEASVYPDANNPQHYTIYVANGAWAKIKDKNDPAEELVIDNAGTKQSHIYYGEEEYVSTGSGMDPCRTGHWKELNRDEVKLKKYSYTGQNLNYSNGNNFHGKIEFMNWGRIAICGKS